MKPLFARLVLASAAVMAGTASRAETVAANVAVAAFDYDDTSGEVKNQAAAHAARLGALQTTIAATLRQHGFAAEALACAAPPCSAGNLDDAQITGAARKQGANYLVFGGVHKVSTLIEFGHVDVMDVASGRALLSREVQFRGDSDDAWHHAGEYIGQMAADALGK